MNDEKKLLIDCRDAALGYEGRAVSSHLNFQVRGGDYLCIVGENGSGKSTLVNLLARFYDATDGQIRIGGLVNLATQLFS